MGEIRYQGVIAPEGYDVKRIGYGTLLNNLTTAVKAGNAPPDRPDR